jgi:ankyrin repeat protein
MQYRKILLASATTIALAGCSATPTETPGTGLVPLQLTLDDKVFLAAKTHDLDLMERVLRYGARVNQQDERGMIALHHAAEHASPSAIKLLAANGADINAVDDQGKTPLSYAVDADRMRPSYAFWLLGAKDPKSHLKGQMSESLYQALVANDFYDLKKAIADGANINSTDYFGRTATHYAVINKNFQMLDFLLFSGAEATIKDAIKGYTPTDYAESLKGFEKGVARLENPDAEPPKTSAGDPRSDTI